MASTASKWEEPVARKLPRAMQVAKAWCYLCGDDHEYDNPCYALRTYREDVAKDMEPTDATD